MSYFQSLKNYLSPAITSRILQGAFYSQAAIAISKEGFLLAPAVDLAPAHINCVRIIFPYSNTTMKAIINICKEWDVAVLLDSINTYGLEGHPILVK